MRTNVLPSPDPRPSQSYLTRNAAVTREGQPRQALGISFTGGALAHRLRLGGGRGQALARAAGFVKGRTPSVVDATAGLGRDALVLASLGARVTLLERSPDVHGLLKEALAAASASGPEFSAIVARMTLVYGDAKRLLPALHPDVVIVDPMHPARRKSALVSMDMRLLRKLVGADEDALELMHVALASARQRVVLKWPRRAPSMQGLKKPSYQIIGKTTRYDVFVTPQTRPGAPVRRC